MNKLKRYESYEDLKKNKEYSDRKKSSKKELELSNFFANLRSYKTSQKNLLSKTSKVYGG